MWSLSISTSPEAEDAISEFLERAFEVPACSYSDVDSGETWVTVFLSHQPRWPHPTQEMLRSALEAMERNGLRLGAKTCRLKRLRSQDWAEAWKKHFKPLEVGTGLLIKPSWSRKPGRKGQAVVVIDPGLSFGTGQHPTTGFCLSQVVARAREGAAKGFLDAGTGSGILAISAAKLGYRPVRAFDFDAEALRIARGNARVNGVGEVIRFAQKDAIELVANPRQKYGLICANLLGDLLVKVRDRLVERLDAQGVLVLAGILKNEFPMVQQVYEACGLKLAASRVQREWRSGAFQRR